MYVVIIILLTTQKVYSLTCKDMLDMPTTKIKLYDLETSQPKEIVDCLSHLGRVRLNISEAEFIWNSIIHFYKEISNIPDEVLASLHWVTVAVKPEDYLNLTLNNIDVVTNFGLDYDLNIAQLTAIADRVREDFGAKGPEDYTLYDLTALRQILCVFDGSEIRRIHPKAYKEAALLIGKLKNCSYDVLKAFASLATNIDAFGSPNTWKKETICILGAVAKYVPDQMILILKKVLGGNIFKETDKNITREEDCD